MREPETSAHQRLRTRAALRDNTLVTAQELELVLPEGLASWVVDQVEPCSVVEGITLYEWGDVRGMLANPPRPKVVEANKRRRAHKKEAPAKRGHLTIAEAAAELGISDRTLRKRLKDGVPRIKGGPVDISSGRYRHWRFPQATLLDWWRALNAHDEPPAKPKRRSRSRPRTTTEKKGPIDWAAAARGDLTRTVDQTGEARGDHD